ncbi:MAG: adenylosuccinate synthetase, partial [Marinoscillum sp.]
WLDLPALKYTCMLNGVTQLFMMKADVLSDMDEIKICHGYKIGDNVTGELPLYLDTDGLGLEFESFKGWKNNDISSFESLPNSLDQYVKYIQEQTNTPISLISLGPDRTQTLMKAEIS